jgi:K+-transporting ATPase ATPase B chain
MSKHPARFDNGAILRGAVRGSFIKLNPKSLIKNPVMFVVETGMAVTLFLTVFPRGAARRRRTA